MLLYLFSLETLREKKMSGQLPPEVQLEITDSSDYGPLYLRLILECWCSSERNDKLGPLLRVIIDCELYWVVNDVLEETDDRDHISVAEKALEDFACKSLRKMLAIANRKLSKAKRGRYQGVQTMDLKLAGIMSMLVSLYYPAYDYILDELTAEQKQLPKP